MTVNVSETVRELRERLEEIQRSGPAVIVPERSEHPPGVTPEPLDPRSGPGVDEGAGLTEEERAEEQQAKTICLRLLADSARPRAGLERKLLQRGISPGVIGRVLDRFTEVGLIDDQAYAEAYVRTKHQERALSRRALAAELRRKGVDDSITDVAVESLDSADEETRATALVVKRVGAATAAGPDAGRRRLLALLDRRGYPADMSIRVVDTVLRRHSDGDLD